MTAVQRRDDHSRRIITLGEYDRALEIFEQALHWCEQQGQPGQIRVARPALAGPGGSGPGYTAASLAEFEGIGEKSGLVFEKLAECLLALGRADEARGYFALAFEELSKDPWLRENEPDRVERLNRLSSDQQVGLK